MQYRVDERSGNKLSILGFGCMRLPRSLGGIDRSKSEQMVLRAVEAGVNYFDTAYLYPGSEEVLGEILEKNKLREKVYVATKLPVANCRGTGDFDRYFTAQLTSLRTDYIDYYLMHNINTYSQWLQLRDWGIEEWIRDKRRAGSIRQVGFSFHGVGEEFLRVLDDYDWDFCQIQYNYSDENYQAGVTGLRRAAEKGMPVVVMEPLLGGKLATGLPKQAVEELQRVESSRSPAVWGLRWLWDQPEVTVVLSGMSNAEQVAENLRAAHESKAGMLTDPEREAYRRVVEIFRATYKVPCTGCGYCLPCPKGVNIPGCFSAYNTSFALGRLTGMFQYVTGTAAHREERNTASMCSSCGTCARHCPQHIAIPEALGDVRRRMEPFYFNWAMAAVRNWRK